MSTTEEIDRYILKKYEVHQRLGKGVRPACNHLLRHILVATALDNLYKAEAGNISGHLCSRLSSQSSLRRGICASQMPCNLSMERPMGIGSLHMKRVARLICG